MEFLINEVTDYSEKANEVQLMFVNTNSILDECTFRIFLPKSVNLNVGEINNLPYYYAKNIWQGYNTEYIVKGLKRQIVAKTKRGQKKKQCEEAIKIFFNLQVLNVEEKVESVGKFVGEIGMEFAIELTYEGIIWKRDYISHGWKHPIVTYKLIRLKDNEGNVYMYSTCANKFVEDMMEKSKFNAMVKIDKHEEYNGVKQTWLSKIKFI